jgi:DNA polymerase (family 10)
MAELLAIRGGDRHRVRAFHRVARVVANLPESVERMLTLGALAKVPGIGEGTLHRVKQILRRGTFDDLERLRAELPPGLREMVKLKGLGPSTVRQLHQRFRISTIDELERLALAGRLAELPRFGVDRIHAILREIEAWKGRRGKAPLVEARGVAETIAGELRDAGAVEVAFGGSLRRWKPMIGDFDLLAAAEDPRPLVERFQSLPGVRTALSGGSAEASVRLESGRQSDLWVFPIESWGAGLHAFSGSKEHVVAVRTRAHRFGLHVSEHGISNRADGRRLSPGRLEEEIFAAVGLPFIEPELRENLGEIQAAESGRLPALVTAEDLRGDLHMHTTASDGSGTALDMARAALELSYEYIAITDHSRSLAVARGLDERRLAAHVKEIRRLEQDLGRLHVLAGSEVDILPDGSLDYEPETLRRLDWVIASVHEHLDMDAERMTARVVRALETGLVDCLGHPTGRRLGRRDPYPLDLERIFDTARRLGVAVEANGDPYRMDLDGAGCRMAREWGVPVAIDTDSHSPAHLRRREFGLASARRGWLEKRHVLNAQPVEALRELRAERLRRQGLVVSVPARTVVIEPRPAASAAVEPGASADLVAKLESVPLGEDVRRRLKVYLETGEDPELVAALSEISANPVQQAFNLLMSS